MTSKSLLTCFFSISVFCSAAVAQVLPSQTDIYNISLDKLENITKDSLKTRLIQLQQAAGNQLSFEQQLQKYLLEVCVGDQYIGLQQLEKLSAQHPNNYSVWNTYAWALLIAEQTSHSLAAIDKAIAIHSGQLGAADHVFRKMVLSSAGELPARNIIELNNSDYYDFLILQTTPKNADSLLSQLHYLVYNRLQYFPQPDSITAQLLIDAGDLIAKKSDRNEGLQYYSFALSNDSSLSQQVKVRTDLIEEGKRSVKSTFNWASAIWAIPLIAMAFIGAAFLKSQKQ